MRSLNDLKWCTYKSTEYYEILLGMIVLASDNNAMIRAIWDKACVERYERSSEEMTMIDHDGIIRGDVMHSHEAPLTTAYTLHGQLKNLMTYLP